MNFLRKLLFPFSLLYGGITALRNFLYNKGCLKSKNYDFPVICVGNLSTGGTGKSPMIELLVSLLKDEYKIAILSRGYKRKTKGYREVLANNLVEEVGDEPLQFKKKYPEITVAVCEDRQTGIEKLKYLADMVLLDDAFQHRKVKASVNILLTSFDKLYSDDCMLPTGNLREPKFGAKRADIIVVTKCPENISDSKIEEIKKKLKLTPYQEIYFSKIGYSSEIKNETESKPLSFLKNQRFLLVTGIANPKPMVDLLKNEGLGFEEKSFPDHHNFTTSEIERLKKHRLILTTEKDFMRLQPIANATEIYYLPIKTVILNEAETSFKRRIERKFKLKE
ncbi:tetraacyldisaccharide 4'-kinase [Aequorivita antarctica]|uniref:Tetraacyldisaccharide 4'-kinase n=1 Tax=Aequorivita antarctica TaxID=153266 RepID=A0A5C6YZJ8_9FLAO|nr:tetraacyldisaccharide 4'-kinase [Aequorivita antarctica]TXD73195.1 tetraacyldisaccharide 4'-kinase [Aequorivita antarctica]SRX74954.1 Tetraacyldisaccharide 4'-kinase [Aequorivita antarctica]